ncbi:perlucin-like [Haliotis rufescens]|uniref:perlucin-like n=1 Tax=Haliotis rufescens TaxID=6454 RepID=UPI00201F203E|nr:perlucin-like [Haliotis rufescens]
MHKLYGVILILVVVIDVVWCQSCPSGFLHHNDSCYSLIRVQASWAEAAVYCQAIGSHLAYVETDSEQTFVEGYLKREDSTITTNGVWIGGLTYLTEREWQWGCQNTRIARTFWAPGDPNNDHGSQWCLMWYKKGDYRWDDNGCHVNEFFLCELELIPPEIVGK